MIAAYRLQLTKDFTFRHAAALVEDLRRLGVSHLYLSPVLEATPGSNHGYDVTDFTKISAEHGGEDELLALSLAAQACAPPLQLLLDIVPNHMAANVHNPYWRDVLTHGRAAQSWPLFDMRVPEHAKIRLPILAAALEALIADGTVALRCGAQGHVQLGYGALNFPLAPAAETALQAQIAASGTEDRAAWLAGYGNEALTKLIDSLPYQFIDWRDTSAPPSYRRFFDIHDLIALRAEDETVFRQTHAKLFALCDKLPNLAGWRVDHIDGLREPAAYLRRLARQGLPIWVEKILCEDERLPSDWPVAGTTGYEFIAHLNAVFVHPAGFAAIENFWRTQVEPRWLDFPACAADCKAQILQDLFSGELARIVALSAGQGADQKAAALFWSELTINLPVYRTYAYNGVMTDDDRRRIESACLAARRRQPDFAAASVALLPQLLHPANAMQHQTVQEWQQLSGPVMAKGVEDTAHYRYTPLAAFNEVGCTPILPADGRAALYDYFNRLAERQPHGLKTSSTHDTKRSEDVRCRLYALADMPQDWLDYVHEARALVQPCRPRDLPFAVEYFFYQNLLGVWPLQGLPDAALTRRLQDYMRKAVREAKQQTSNARPDEDFENKLSGFIAACLRHEPFLARTARLAQRLALCGACNALNALILKILSPGTPDIYQGNEVWDFSLVDPDNRRPVDYAARHTLLNALAAAAPGAPLLARLCGQWRDGRIKLHLTQQLLAIKSGFALAPHRVEPLTAQGAKAQHILAYRMKGGNGASLAVVTCRYPHALLATTGDSLLLPDHIWDDTAIPALAGGGRNLLTQESYAAETGAVPSMLGSFPFAVLTENIR